MDSPASQLTIEIEVIHAGEVGLGLSSNETNTVWFPTVTRLWIVAFPRGENGIRTMGCI
jgi:hypothetical protein